MTKYVRYVGPGDHRVLGSAEFDTLEVKVKNDELSFRKGEATEVTNALHKVLTDPAGRVAGEFQNVSPAELKAAESEDDSDEVVNESSDANASDAHPQQSLGEQADDSSTLLA